MAEDTATDTTPAETRSKTRTSGKSKTAAKRKRARKAKKSGKTPRAASTPVGKAPKRPAKTRTPPPTKAWTFPKVSLERAIDVAQAIEEKNAGKPLRSEDLAPMVGYRRSGDWRYLDLLRAANQYGLVTGSGTTVSVARTDGCGS
jgi:hypothetical protein